MNYSLSSLYNFGKHKGKSIKQVIDEDINYVVWCISDIPEFKLDKESELYFRKNKQKIFINHSRISSKPAEAMWQELLKNEAILSDNERENLWNEAIDILLKK